MPLCARYAGAAFAPHIERCLASLLESHDYFHEDVRGASCRSLAQLVNATAKAEGLPPWSKGQPASACTLGASTRTIVDKVAPLLMI